MSGHNNSLELDLHAKNGNNKSSKNGEKVRGSNQSLEYREGTNWVPAVYHHTIRAFLIAQASRNGEYSYGRERGSHPEDITSFLESQKDWGPVRGENWPDILYVFEKNEHQKDPEYKLKNWKVGGRIVLSGHDNLPMPAFKDIPHTLSSALEGRDMEAMKRTDPRIQHRDFLARMPMYQITRSGTRAAAQSSSSISMKMCRFRAEQGMPSWIERVGTQTIRYALWERLPEENRQKNSIRGLEPPTLDEQQEIRMGNAGKFFSRAGKRALPSKERIRRQKIMENRNRRRREGRRPATGDLGVTNPQGMPCKPDDNGLVGREGGRPATGDLGVTNPQGTPCTPDDNGLLGQEDEPERYCVRDESPDNQEMQALETINPSILVGDGTLTSPVPRAGLNHGILSQGYPLDTRYRRVYNQFVHPPMTISTSSPVLNYQFQPTDPFLLGSTMDTSLLTGNLGDGVPYESVYQSPPAPPRDNDFGSSLAVPIEKSSQLPYPPQVQP